MAEKNFSSDKSSLVSGVSYSATTPTIKTTTAKIDPSSHTATTPTIKTARTKKDPPKKQCHYCGKICRDSWNLEVYVSKINFLFLNLQIEIINSKKKSDIC